MPPPWSRGEHCSLAAEGLPIRWCGPIGRHALPRLVQRVQRKRGSQGATMDISPSLPRAVRSLAVLGACVGAARPAAPAHATAVAPAPLVTAVVDAGRTSPPINPDLYGMFIEHAGGLVYRGLWAELIDDRKFFNPITNDATEAQPAPR